MKKFLLSTLCLLLAGTAAYADDTTTTYVMNKYEKVGDVPQVTDNQNGTWIMSIGPGSNQLPADPTKTTAEGRGACFGGSGTFTSTATFSNVTKIVLDCSTNNTNNSIIVKVGGTQIGSSFTMPKANHQKPEFESQTPLSGAIEINITRSAGSIWIGAVTVTESDSSEPGQTVNVEGISLDPETASLYPDQTVQLKATVTPSNATNKAVTWSSSNEAVATVSESGLVKAVAVGDCTITATSDADATISATCAVTVNELVLAGEGEGTATNPYNVARALDILAKGVQTTDNVYVAGVVTEVTEVYLQNGNATYNIKDSAEDENALLIFRGKYLENANFTSEDQIQVNDEVVVCGVLKDYNGTLEMNPNYLVSLNRPGATTVTLSYDANGGEGTMEAVEYFEGGTATAAVCAFTKEGYVFTEWNTAADGSGTAYGEGATFTISTDMTLYAQWTEAGEEPSDEYLRATIDFTSNEEGDWTPALPTSKTTAENTYTDKNGVKVTLADPDAKNGYYFVSKDSYLLLGKANAYLTLSAFDFPTSSIRVYGTSVASATVEQNIFVGENEVSTKTIGAKFAATDEIQYNNYEIAPAFQAAGNVYTLKILPSGSRGEGANTQIKKIEVYSLAPTAVETIGVDADQTVRFFNLQGVEVSNPTNGIFVRVANGKATKILVK